LGKYLRRYPEPTYAKRTRLFARVIGWDSPRKHRFIVPMRRIADIRDVPLSARNIVIQEFDERGNPLHTKASDLPTVSREKLEREYDLTP